ncbi:hypothetical protein A3Q56_08471 [Intoshia linei]|uniref:Dynein heavy chain AAA module D4 domain-containing protein n=1 Tax=Intoshia linei TaxID=1819745 RepID=A0A177AQW3_9BILA|nr:hypothetical protein A3Q56_08471 [Intoshia linei]
MFGSIIILNRSGTIQMEVLKLATYAFQLKLLNISVGRNYNEKVFCSDIKQAIHMACVEDEKVLLLIEQDNLINSKILPKLDGIFESNDALTESWNLKNIYANESTYKVPILFILLESSEPNYDIQSLADEIFKNFQNKLHQVAFGQTNDKNVIFEKIK